MTKRNRLNRRGNNNTTEQQPVVTEATNTVIQAEHAEETSTDFTDAEVAEHEAMLVSEQAETAAALEAEPIDPTEDTVVTEVQPTEASEQPVEVQATEASEQQASEQPVEVQATEATEASEQPVEVQPEVNSNGLTSEDVAAIDAELSAAASTEVTETPVTEPTASTEVTVTEQPKAEETSTEVTVTEQPKAEETKAEETVKPPRGAAVFKRWSAGTVKDGRPTLFAKDVKDYPDNAELVLHRKDNPKHQSSKTRFDYILLGKCKTVGQYRQKFGAKVANEDIAWDTNRGFYSVRFPEKPAEIEQVTTGEENSAAA